MTRAVSASLALVAAITAANTSAQPATTPARKLDIARHGCDYVSRMEFSRDGSVLAVADSGDRVLQLWSVADGRHIHTLHGAEANEDFALSLDGKILAVPNNQAGEVVLWDVPGGKELCRLKQPGVSGVSFSPVGHVLTTYSAHVDADCNRDELLVWDTATGKQLYATKSRPEIHITFAADGRLLFWGYDRRLRCWDPATRQERPPVNLPTDTDGYLTPSPSGNEVLALDRKSGRLRLHDATTLKVLRGFGEGVDALFADRIEASWTPGELLSWRERIWWRPRRLRTTGNSS